MLPEAKAAAGHHVAARTLYYKVRPLVQQYTDKELDYAYFSQTLLPEYERDRRAAARSVLRGARRAAPPARRPGDPARHPRSGGVHAAAVAVRQGPLHREGRAWRRSSRPISSGSATTWPSSTARGIAVTACRDLLARSEIRDMKIFVLHDADINGYNIARTLGEATGRMPNHSVDVIDLGLTVPQAIDARAGDREVHPPQGAAGRPGTRRRRAANGSPANRYDAGYGKPHYECTRCELNAFSSDELAEFIEAGLQRHGATDETRAPSGCAGRACADGPRRGAHRPGCAGTREHGRHR